MSRNLLLTKLLKEGTPSHIAIVSKLGALAEIFDRHVASVRDTFLQGQKTSHEKVQDLRDDLQLLKKRYPDSNYELDEIQLGLYELDFKKAEEKIVEWLGSGRLPRRVDLQGILDIQKSLDPREDNAYVEVGAILLAFGQQVLFEKYVDSLKQMVARWPVESTRVELYVQLDSLKEYSFQLSDIIKKIFSKAGTDNLIPSR